MASEESRTEGEYRFHYDREERIRRSGREERVPQTGGIFKRNRSLAIILLDLIIVLIIFVIFGVIFRPDPSTGRAEGCEFTLRAVAYADQTLVSVRIRNVEGTLTEPQRIVTVTAGPPDKPASTQVKDLIPEKGKERVVRATLPPLPAGEVTSRISVAGSSLTLTTNIVEE